MAIDLSIIKPWMPLISPGIGAFFGALFAFWVSQLNERVKRYRRRWVEHRNAYVELEHKLNENLGIVADNRYLALSAIDADAHRSDETLLIWSSPQPLLLDTSLPRLFLRLEMINELMSYNEKIRKLNDDTRVICRAYEEMRAAKLRNDLTSDQYLSSFREYCAGLETLVRAYDLMDSKTEVLLARTRVTLREDSKHDKHRFFWMPTLMDITEEHIHQERKLVSDEIRQVQEGSRREIDEYLR